MARIKLDLDSETYMHLLRAALAERRPVIWQAEIMLRQALGLPFPYPSNSEGTTVAELEQEQEGRVDHHAPATR